MKIFLTGHKGNIGGNLFSRFKKEHVVYGFDIKEGKDISTEEQVYSSIKSFGTDAVIHCAAIPSPRGPNNTENFENFWRANVIGTKNVALSALKLRVKKLVYFSSGAVYGWDDNLETGEIEQYGISKRIAESIIRWVAGQGLCSSILRLAPVATTPSEAFFFATLSYETIFKFVMEAIYNPKWLSIYNVSEREYQGIEPLWKVGEISDDFIRTPNYSSII